MIQLVEWTESQSRAILNALNSIATLNGTALAARPERELIDGVRTNILRHFQLVEDAVHIHPEQLSEALPDPENRDRAAQLIALMPFTVRPYSGPKMYIMERYLEALGKSMHTLEDFLGARMKQVRSMEYCALRKMGPDVVPYADAAGLTDEIAKLLEEAQGDPDQLERYKSLKGYPKGSLGRAFWDFYAQFNWPLPGDPLWISEDLTVRHDLVHILCDYDISINGEFRVSAFAAGNSNCFNWLIAMLGFTPPYISTGEQFRAADFFEAYMCGASAAESFVDNWDFWPMLEFQIEDLRREYRIQDSVNRRRQPSVAWSRASEMAAQSAREIAERLRKAKQPENDPRVIRMPQPLPTRQEIGNDSAQQIPEAC